MLPSEPIVNKPWSKRAALTPRKTYSAESSITYKRKKHFFTLADYDRIQRSLETELDRRNAPKEERLTFFQKVLKWMREKTISMMTILLADFQPKEAIEPLYDLIHDTGAAMIDYGALSIEAKRTLEKTLQEYLLALLSAKAEFR